MSTEDTKRHIDGFVYEDEFPTHVARPRYNENKEEIGGMMAITFGLAGFSGALVGALLTYLLMK